MMFKFVDEMKQPKLQWLPDVSQINGDRNSVRCKTSGHFCNKKAMFER
jgi:hypothetical protein